MINALVAPSLLLVGLQTLEREALDAAPILRATAPPVVGSGWSLEASFHERRPGMALLVVSHAPPGDPEPRVLLCEVVPHAVGTRDLWIPLPAEPALAGLELRAGVICLRDGVQRWSEPVVGVVRREDGAAAVATDGLPDAFGIRSCSLGCTGDRTSVSCSVTEVFVNEEIRVSFSQGVQLSSVTPSSFELTELSTGKKPAGTVRLDPEDPSVLIYQPQLTFDSSGNPVFGLEENRTYRILIPGSVLDPASPHVLSSRGMPNRTRLSCLVIASRGLQDPVPGAPTASVTVDLVTCPDPSMRPDCLALQQPAQGATNVFLGTSITVRFGDVMNPASLVNPVTGESPGIAVRMDPDGNTADPSDQSPVAGSFSIAIDQARKETSVVFDPASDLPRAGNEVSPLKIVVELSPTIEDLGANPLANPGSVVFVPEL